MHAWVARKACLGVGILSCLCLATPATAALEVQLEPAAVLVSGVTPGGEVAWLGVGRISKGYFQQVLTHRELTRADEAGHAELAVAEGVPVLSLWAAVDVASGEYAVAVPEGSARWEMPWTGGLVAGGEGQPDSLRLAEKLYELLLVRPGAGAWGLLTSDGGPADAGGREDGEILLPLDRLEAVGAETPELARAEPGDLLLALDLTRMGYAATRLTEEEVQAARRGSGP